MNETIGTATYSPEDNKLRLYPFARLDTETYQRVKAAGFSWAPKQELFVAPMWTPGREDLLLELCEEIGDEDTSLVERAEERAERFEEYSEKRLDDYERAHTAVDQVAKRFEGGATYPCRPPFRETRPERRRADRKRHAEGNQDVGNLEILGAARKGGHSCGEIQGAAGRSAPPYQGHCI